MPETISAVCPKCGGEVIATLTPELIHHAGGRCQSCQRHVWIKKPDDDPTKYKRPAASTNLAQKDYCEMCLRRKCDLPENTTLHGHHVIEVQEGGVDSVENLWTVCTACHRLIHWTRTYHKD